jgi:hypothetical protein
VGADYNRGTLLNQHLDGWQGCANSAIVSDLTVLDRHVQITAENNPLASKRLASDASEH